MANRFLSNIKINDAYTFPASDGSNGQVIVTDGAGNLAFANPATSSSASIIYRDNFTGDGSTTVFYLQNSLSDEDQTQIYIDGVYQEKGTYSLSNNAITFTTAPPNGDSVEVISISGINVGPTTIYQDNFTGDGTTTDFTLAQSVNDEVKTMVYFNGVYQFKGTYSLNGTLMSFDTAPSNGVAIEVISIASAAAADYNQKMLFYGKASEAMSKGDAVMLSGQQGDHFLLAKATQAAIASNHEYFLGLASQDLAQGEFGYVTEFGKIIEIDTSGYTAGDVLWFDAGGSTAGALTTTEPAAPLAKIQVAAVIRSHQNEGVLFIRPTWYHELGEMHDVNVISVADKDLLVWNDTQGYWENSKTVDTLTGNTFTATTLTGTLSTAAQPNVTSVGTLSSLGVSGDLTVDTDTLYVDSTNNRVGIGTTSLEAKLSLYNNASQGNPSNHTPANATLKIQDSSNTMYLDGNSIINTGQASFTFGNTQAASILFYTSASEKMRLDASGNVGIGTTTPTAKLHVNGGTGENTTKVIIGGNDAIIRLGDNQGGGPHGIQFDGYSATDGMSMYYRTTPEQICFEDSTNISGNRVMVIGRDGRVGIGTTSPSATLDVHAPSTTAPSLTMGATAGQIFKNEDLEFAFGLNNASPYNGWIQARFAGDTARSISINPLGGSVGIGTNSPYKALEVKNSYNGSQLSLRSTSGNAGNAGLRFSIADNTVSSDSYHKASIWLTGDNTGNALGDLTFNVNNVSNSSNVGSSDEKMRLTREGYLGIGTTNPGYGLHVTRGVNGYSAGFNESVIVGNGTTPSNLRFANVTGAYNTFQLGSRIFQYFPDGNGTAEASIYFNRSNGTGGGVTSGAEISFHTTKNTYGPYGRETDEERMRITQTGNIKLSSTTTQSIDFAYGGGVNKGGIKIDYNTGEYRYYVGESGNTYYKTFRINDVERMRITSIGGITFKSGVIYDETRFAAANTYSDPDPGVQRDIKSGQYGIAAASLSVSGSKNFTIPHPVKDGYRLRHAAVESPQVNNIYRGKVQLINGSATINIDEVSQMTEGTFEALNRDVHVYTSNESDWDAVKGSIEGNILTISCQNTDSDAIVSWLVIGERQDIKIKDSIDTDDDGRLIVESKLYTVNN